MRTFLLASFALAVLASTSATATAATPAGKLKQVLETLKSDTDEKKRKAAADELTEFDPRSHGEVWTGLITSLRQDPAVSVRTAAAEAIRALPKKGEVPDPRYSSYVPRLLEDLPSALKSAASP